MTGQTMIRLRDYQQEAQEKVFAAWAEGLQRPGIVLPTGAGKTVVFSHIAQHFIDKQSGPLDTLRVRPSGARRVVVLVHRDELADQALAKLRAVAPGLRTGKVKAADNDITADVMVCSVQTVARHQRMNTLLDAQSYAGDIGLVIVDECHHALAVSYRNVMAALGCYDPDSGAVALGVTATMARGDGLGLGEVWQDVVYQRSLLWMISKGYLTDVRAHRVDLEQLDLKGVKRSGGDYSAKSLGDALLEADAPAAVTQVLQEQAADRRSIIVFTPTVDVAQETAAHLNRSGLTAGVVHGGTRREDRLRLYEAFRTGALRVLVNCMVLTEGADFPYADCAVIARPTNSETLFIQMAGRVLRPSPQTGKRDALLLLIGGQGGTIRTLVDLDPAVVIPAQDGESLAEAHERQEDIREEQEARRAARESRRPARLRLTTKAVDLFGSSPAYQWLRTEAGGQFIPLGGNGVILLWPSAEEEGLWDVVWAPEQRRVPWERLHTGLDLGVAMAWAESEADERSLLNTGKSASWRRKLPSEKLVRFAKMNRVIVGPDDRAGEVSDAIAVAQTSRKIDRILKELT